MNINNIHIINFLIFINAINCIKLMELDLPIEKRSVDVADDHEDPDSCTECDETVEKVNKLFETFKQLDLKTINLILENMETFDKHLQKRIEQIVEEKIIEKMDIIEDIVANKLEEMNERNQDFPPESPSASESPYNVHEITCAGNRSVSSCHDLNKCTTNIYAISIPEVNPQPFPVACDLDTLDGGWTIIQRRQDGSENFNRNWTDYVEGFGNLNGEFFIGLKKIHALTTLGEPQELYVILEDFKGEERFAKYGEFKVFNETENFKLQIGQYSGNAGDSLGPHNGLKFSTHDRDHDSLFGNCARYFKGGWWFNQCYNSYLNGEYSSDKHKQGRIIWSKFHGSDYSLKFVQMMIRPRKD